MKNLMQLLASIINVSIIRWSVPFIFLSDLCVTNMAWNFYHCSLSKKIYSVKLSKRVIRCSGLNLRSFDDIIEHGL